VAGQRRRGSGYRVSEHYVLTAAHVVEGINLQVWVEGDAHNARIVWRSTNRDVDLALVLVETLEPVPSVEFVVLNRRVNRWIEPCEAIGYPEWHRVEAGQYRPTGEDSHYTTEEAAVRGAIPTRDGLDPRNLHPAFATLRITDLNLPQTPQGALAETPWGGMSGSAVTTTIDGRVLLLGVIAMHNMRQGGSALSVTPFNLLSALQSNELSQLISLLHLPPFDRWRAVPNAERMITPSAGRSGPVRADFRHRRDALGKVRHIRINQQLGSSLRNAAHLSLGLQRRPVIDLGARVYRSTDDLLQPDLLNLPKEELFHRLGNGLVILGRPGSGKTTWILELTEELLDIAEHNEDERLPVVLDLASWNERSGSLENWMVAELNTSYGVPMKIARRWIRDDALILMLDALDEVPADLRPSCSNAILGFRQRHGAVPFVITSRTDEYRDMSERVVTTRHSSEAAIAGVLATNLGVGQVLELIAPNDDQVDDYLHALEDAGTTLSAVRESLASDSQFKAFPSIAAGPPRDRVGIHWSTCRSDRRVTQTGYPRRAV
jgi:hypothetical protein